MSAPVRVAHLSMWFGANPEHVGIYVKQTVDRYHLDLVTTTESKGKKNAVAKALGKDFKVMAIGEHLVCFRRSTFKRAAFPSHLHRAALLPWFTTRGHPMFFLVAMAHLVRVETGRRWKVQVCHGPSHVQSGGAWQKEAPRRVSAAKVGYPRWGRWVHRTEHRFPKRVQLACFDSNLDQHRDEWRHWLETTLGMPSVWHYHRPAGGTHAAGRLIDTAHSNTEMVEAEISAVTPPHDVDHRGIVFDVIE